MDKYKMKSIVEFTDEEKIKAFNNLHFAVEEYIRYINSNKFHPDNDYEYYLYEDLICEIAGTEFWEFYRKKVQ